MDEATDNFITWKKTYRLRHSISNRYLCVGAELTKRPSHNGKGGSSDGLKYYTAEMVDSENLAGSKSEFIIKNTEETSKKDFPSITDCTDRYLVWPTLCPVLYLYLLLFGHRALSL